MTKHKHLSFDERLTIERELVLGSSFKKIAYKIDKNCSTISKEIRNHYSIKNTGSYGRIFNNCIKRSTCNLTHLCYTCIQKKNRLCKNCSKCKYACPEYREEKCEILKQPPYVCNGCPKLLHCTLTKHIYDSSYAYKEYKDVLSETRSGITTTNEEIDLLNSIFTPLVKNQHQSIHHVYINNQDRIMMCEKSLYKIIDLGLLEVRNIDLPRKVRYRERRKTPKAYKIDKQCLEGRRYEDFLNYIEEYPDMPIVQMDTVEGRKGGKVLLTIHFVATSFMLAFIRDQNDSQSVIDIFNYLQQTLIIDKFKELFVVILTDNGSEFSNPTMLEFDNTTGESRTKIFYCHPSSPFEKGACEVNHQLLRKFIPKGESFDHLSQPDINLMMSHINSYKRKKLNNNSPLSLFSTIYGKTTLDKLGILKIEPNKVDLSKSIFR